VVPSRNHMGVAERLQVYAKTNGDYGILSFSIPPYVKSPLQLLQGLTAQSTREVKALAALSCSTYIPKGPECKLLINLLEKPSIPLCEVLCAVSEMDDDVFDEPCQEVQFPYLLKLM
jgi:hypothetical protein